MANNTAVFITVSNNVLLVSVVFKFITMTIGVLGNVTVIIYTIFLSKERTARNLAWSDLRACLTFYPIWIIEFVHRILSSIDSDQDLFCKFSRSTVWAIMIASNATLLATVVDCYVYIVKPLR